MSRIPRLLLGLACLAAPGVAPAHAGAGDSPRFAFRDGDRVVLIGDDLIERDQKFGYLETFLTVQNPDRSITFRNLGWSGDTVFGHARAGFGTPADGFQRLREHVKAQPPTVLIVGYGMAESFDGEPGLSRFVEGYHRLLDAITPTGARLVLLSPIAHEDLGRPLPDAAGHNKALKLYRDAIERIAKERGAWFVDLFTAGPPVREGLGRPLTDDGIHLNDLGAWWFATEVARALGPPGPYPARSIAVDRGSAEGTGVLVRVGKVEAREDRLRFEATAHHLPLPFPAEARRGFRLLDTDLTLRAGGLAPGGWRLAIDGKPVARASAREWSRGVEVVNTPDRERVKRLRAAIVEKNRLYFYRWRPQNETYLFGFRKHEQGNNAREIPLFDPLVAAKEEEIAALRVPATHAYELTREGEVPE